MEMTHRLVDYPRFWITVDALITKFIDRFSATLILICLLQQPVGSYWTEHSEVSDSSWSEIPNSCYQCLPVALQLQDTFLWPAPIALILLVAEFGAVDLFLSSRPVSAPWPPGVTLLCNTTFYLAVYVCETILRLPVPKFGLLSYFYCLCAEIPVGLLPLMITTAPLVFTSYTIWKYMEHGKGISSIIDTAKRRR
jgi:hypothetical protein